MHAEIDNEEGGAIYVWNVHACGFLIASKLCIPCKKTSLASSRRYRVSNFTNVIVNTMSNMSWDAKKCSKQAAA